MKNQSDKIDPKRAENLLDEDFGRVEFGHSRDDITLSIVMEEPVSLDFRLKNPPPLIQEIDVSNQASDNSDDLDIGFDDDIELPELPEDIWDQDTSKSTSSHDWEDVGAEKTPSIITSELAGKRGLRKLHCKKCEKDLVVPWSDDLSTKDLDELVGTCEFIYNEMAIKDVMES
jgi:hypothetical protein